MIGGVVGFQFGRVLRLLVVRGRDGEVRRVVEHVFFLGVYIDLHVRHGERGGLMDGIGHLFDGIPFRFGVVGAERLFEFDVGIERVIIRTRDLFAVRDIQRHLNLGGFGQKSSSFQCGAYRKLVEVLHVTIHHV